jgi:hypothetical protein
MSAKCLKKQRIYGLSTFLRTHFIAAEDAPLAAKQVIYFLYPSCLTQPNKILLCLLFSQLKAIGLKRKKNDF